MPSEGPSISVTIPVYGRPEWLRRTVESAAAQGPDELLVVDDASEADVRAALEALPIRYVRNSANLGMVRNWNRCMELAAGDVVNVLHSDETLAPDALLRVRRAFRDHPELGMVYSGQGSAGEYVPAGAAAAAELCRGVFPCSSVFVARRALDLAGGYDESLPYSPDQEFYPRIARAAAVLRLHPPLARGSDHRGRHMFTTWAQPDFYEQYRRVRLLARGHAGQTGADLDRGVAEDMEGARRYIVDTAWRHGLRAIARRALAGGSPSGADRFWRALTFVPLSGWIYRLLRPYR